ncbi:MAG: glycine/sarcosine/betaine reductase component B subunit [Deltaproteobacteria bacterium]|jgi:hypothetical protein|nr:glycine/sarcosine/betaine reductase component B subunit [Deltaproteobacteria bacterium]
MSTSPSTKETTLHHYRDPLASRLWADPDIDFTGVILQATSDDCTHKRFVARRTAIMAAQTRPDGVLVCIDAWGNAHVDFASVIEFIGKQGIPLVGLSFAGVQAAFVVTNPYMDCIVDLNKTAEGVENGVIGDNTAVELDAVKAIGMLKNKIRRKNPGRIIDPSQSRLQRKLQIFEFPLRSVEASSPAGPVNLSGSTTSSVELSDGVLRLNLRELEKKVFAWKGEGDQLLQRLEKISVSIIEPGHLDVFVNAILDFAPLAAKIEGDLGEGDTNLLTGAQLMLTAVDSAGFQPINAGAATGILKNCVRLGRPGTPAPEDYIIHVDVLLKEGEAKTREGIMAAHLASDIVIGEVRTAIRELNRYQAAARRKLIETARPDLLRVALVKMTSGVSAMGDTALFPKDPGGFIESRSIMDFTHNLPLLLSPNEYMDGVIRSMS